MMKLSCALLGLGVVCVSAPALAGLGGDATSVETDRVSMKAALRVTPFVDYEIHEIQTPAGTVIHEYVSAQGKVFAVSWRGTGLPDLSQLLGGYIRGPLPHIARRRAPAATAATAADDNESPPLAD